MITLFYITSQGGVLEANYKLLKEKRPRINIRLDYLKMLKQHFLG